MDIFEIVVCGSGAVIVLSLIGLFIAVRRQAAEDRSLNQRIDEYARRWEDD